MDFLEESFKSDPIITTRFRKHMAGPKRIPWKNSKEIQRNYRWQFFMNFGIGFCVSWPLAVLFGRRMKHTAGGVPAYPI